MPLRTRRDFVKQSSLAIAALGTSGTMSLPSASRHTIHTQSDSAFKELCLVALNAARSTGASYADVRIVDRREQYIEASQERVSKLDDRESLGVGVRTLVDGAWGFASSEDVTRETCTRLAIESADRAKEAAPAVRRPVRLAPVDAYPDGEWMTPIRREPFRVPDDEKIELLIDANREALLVPGVLFAQSFMYLVRSRSTFASTDGSIVEQTLYRTYPSMTVTAINSDSSERRSRSSFEISPMGKGYEHVLEVDLLGQARRVGEEAVEKLSARSIVGGQYDVVIDPSNLCRTIHETIGYPTQLGQIEDTGATDPQSSFLRPPEAVIGRLQFGPEFLNVVCDRTQRSGLATVGWDDEGVPADSWAVVQDGVFVDYQTTRAQAPRLSSLTGKSRSHGCSVARSWDGMQGLGMPNVSVLPGENDYVLDDLIAATDRGVLVKGHGAYSLGQERSEFQFGGQLFYEIAGGRIRGMLKDAAYKGSTVSFWNSLAMLGGTRSYVLTGLMDSGIDRRELTNPVSHGCPAARFSDVTLINAAS